MARINLGARHSLVFLVSVVLCIVVLSREGQSGEPGPAARRRTKLEAATAPSDSARGPEKGTLILCSLQTREIRRRFIQLAGGETARFVVVVNETPAGADLNGAALKIVLSWGVAHVTVWHADDAKGAADEKFLAALKEANGVWFTGGHPDLYADPYVGSPAEKELNGVLMRGGVIGGESAGAMIQASHLMNTANQVRSMGPAPACYRGFGFLHGGAIFPHFAGGRGKFPMGDCEKLIGANRGLVGIGIDDGAGVIVTQDALEAMGTGEVTVLYRDKKGEGQSKVMKAGERRGVGDQGAN